VVNTPGSLKAMCVGDLSVGGRGNTWELPTFFVVDDGHQQESLAGGCEGKKKKEEFQKKGRTEGGEGGLVEASHQGDISIPRGRRSCRWNK